MLNRERANVSLVVSLFVCSLFVSIHEFFNPRLASASVGADCMAACNTGYWHYGSGYDSGDGCVDLPGGEMCDYDFTECILNCCIVETASYYSGPPMCEAEGDFGTLQACYAEANFWCS